MQMDRTTLEHIVLGSDLLKRYLYKYVTVGIPSQPIHNKLIIAAEFIPMWEKVTRTNTVLFLGLMMMTKSCNYQGFHCVCDFVNSVRFTYRTRLPSLLR